MNRKIFAFLKRKGLTDIRMVNRLFVSAYMRHHNLVPQVNPLLMDAYISENSNDNAILCELTSQLDICKCEYTLEGLTKLFEFVISPEDRKVSGAIYTPEYIRSFITREVFVDYDRNINDAHVADIACGCGGFLLTVAEYIHKKTNKAYASIIEENLLGVDIQDYSIERTRLLLSLLALEAGEDVNIKFNLWNADSLSFDFSVMNSIDVIVGNPPYVCARNMSLTAREQLKKWRVCQSGNSDLYIPFFQIATEIIREGGRIGYITMNSFLTSLNGRALREYFHHCSLKISIVDFRGTQMFQGKNTYTCLFFLNKIPSNYIWYCVNESKCLPKKIKYTSHCYDQLDCIAGWKLNAYNLSKKSESIGLPLGKYCQSRHGIATLSNKTFVFKPFRETDDTFIFKHNNQNIEVEKAICRKIVNSNKLNSEIVFDDIVEYVIFPYHQNENGQMSLIPENDMRNVYPLTYRYLCTCKETLAKRDKGNTKKYPAWYAYGRTQSLQMPRYKLFFPKIANKPLHCELIDDMNLLLYNGMAFVSADMNTVLVLKRILESNLFWDYITRNSKPYASGYYSLNGVNIKNFGIPNFTAKQQSELLAITNQHEINNWLRRFYEDSHLTRTE